MERERWGRLADDRWLMRKEQETYGLYLMAGAGSRWREQEGQVENPHHSIPVLFALF